MNIFKAVQTIVIALLLFSYSYGQGQDLSTRLETPRDKKEAHGVSVRLDESTLINSNYTTFLRYSLSGNFEQASIQIMDSKEKIISTFPISPAVDGAIAIPARSLSEGIYQVKLIVDGQTQSVHPLRVVR